MMVKKIIYVIITAAFIAPALVAVGAPSAEKKFSRGVWVTVFSEKRVHFSKQAVTDLVSFCGKNGISDIYFQIYRAGEAWYDSRVAGRKRYEAMVAAAGCDPIDFLIAEAGARGIRVHGWINVLSIAQNLDAPILVKYGRDVLTRDQRGHFPYKRYGGEDQLFLEPGDERVVRFTRAVVDEVIARYPGLSGMHLDYIRYPKAVKSTGILWFRRGGLSYGFGPRNVARFQLAKGKDPYDDPWSGSWDSWKKRQVTSLEVMIHDRIRQGAPGWKLSCAVMPSAEKSAAQAMQEWPQWLKRGTVDYVVLMNYTRDVNVFMETARMAAELGTAAQIHVGVGVYMLTNMTWTLQKKLRDLEALNPGGIVYFAYDDICRKGIENILNGSAQALKPKKTVNEKKKTKTAKAKKSKKGKKKR